MTNELLIANDKIDRKQHSPADLNTLDAALNTWLTANGIYMSPMLATAVWNYRQYILSLVTHADVSPDWGRIAGDQRSLTKFLRAELGVYDTDVAGKADLKRPHLGRLMS